MAMWDQNEISGVSEIAELWMSACCQQRWAQDMADRLLLADPKGLWPKQDLGKMHVEAVVVTDMVELDQVIGQMCPAWGQTCRACGKQNHFERVCQSKGEEKWGAMRCIKDEEATIVHIVFDPAMGTYKPGNSSLEELEVTLIPFSPCPDSKRIRDIPDAYPTRLKIYSDSSATICLSGLTYLRHMGLSERNLDPSKKKKGTHCRRIFLGISKLVTCHIRNWESNHKAGSVYMQQKTSKAAGIDVHVLLDPWHRHHK